MRNFAVSRGVCLSIISLLLCSISQPASSYDQAPGSQSGTGLNGLLLSQVTPPSKVQRSAMVSRTTPEVIVSGSNPRTINLTPGSDASTQLKGKNLNVEKLVAQIFKGDSTTPYLRARLQPDESGLAGTLTVGASSKAQAGDYRVFLVLDAVKFEVPVAIKVIIGQGLQRKAVTAEPSKSAMAVESREAAAQTKASVTAMGRIPAKREEAPSLYLEIQKFSGEMVQWVDEWAVQAPTDELTFRFRATRDDIRWVEWEASNQPFPPPDGRQDNVKIVRTGNLGVAPAGEGWRIFTINFKQIVPLPPPEDEMKIYLRLRGRKYPTADDPSNHIGMPSSPVIVNYVPPGDPTRFTTRGLYPELWTPMPIQVHAGPLHILRADEEDDEEPYVIIVLIYADGTTINLLEMGNSSVRVMATQKTHGNVWNDGDLGSGDSPFLLEDFPATHILPIGLNVLELLEGMDATWSSAPTQLTMMDNAFVFVLAAALEEDETTTADANAIRSTLVNAIEKEVNSAIRNIDLGVNLDLDAIEGQFNTQMNVVVENVMAAVDEKTDDIIEEIVLTLPFSFAQAVDPDDFIGHRFEKVSYREILDAGPAGVPFSLDIETDCGMNPLCDPGAHYLLDVRITKQP